MSAVAEFVAFPRIVGVVAEACYNEPTAREIAGKESLVDYDEAEASTQQFWRFIAAAALEASGHRNLVAALEAVELARNSDEAADWESATKLTDAALAKARAEQVHSDPLPKQVGR